MRGLWARLARRPEFLKLWGGQTISVFGDQITALALPLAAVLTVDASPAEMGVLTAAGWAPHLVFSLAAGVWVDRRRRRKWVMVAMDGGRALVLASVPVAYWLDVLTMEQLYAVAFAVGALTVLFDVSYSAFFVLLVPREEVVDANSKLSVSRSASYMGGPALAGVLVEVLRAPVALLADAVSFLGSALLIARIRVEEPPPDAASDGESIWTRLAWGLRFLFRHPVLRAALLGTATINFFNFVFAALVILYMSERLGLSPAWIGAIFGVGAVGSLVGAVVAPRISRRLGMGPSVVLGAILFPAPLLLFPLAGGPKTLVVTLLIAGEFFSGLGVMIFDVNSNSLSVLLTPHGLRARLTGSHRTINYGVRPLGALAGGVLGDLIGLRPALWIGAAGALLGVLWLLASPMPSVREPPEPEPA